MDKNITACKGKVSIMLTQLIATSNSTLVGATELLVSLANVAVGKIG